MRIAYVCADPGVSVFGRKGSSIHVQEFIRALLNQGVSVDLFASNVEDAPPADFGKIRIIMLPPLPKMDLVLREQAALDANYDLRVALEKNGHYDLIYERYSLWSYAGMEYAHESGIMGMLEVNTPLVEEQSQYRGLINRVEAERIAERVFRTASILIAVSEEIFKYLASYLESHGHVYVIPNGVNPKYYSFHDTADTDSSKDTFTIGFAGSLKPWLGLSVLVDAFARLYKKDSNVRLLVVGDGPARKEMQSGLARYNLLDKVNFTGMVAPYEFGKYLAEMDVAVAPYPALSNFYFSPIKVFEYMAAGLPIIASNIGQMKKLIRHGVNGLLCPPGDSAALISTLDYLRCNPNIRNRLGQAARKEACNKYTWDNVVKSILNVYDQASAHTVLYGDKLY